MSAKKNILFGLYDDETKLMSAIKKANADHLPIYDVLTPFPVHGLDPLLDLRWSRLHIVGFVFGALGALFAFLTMTWIFTDNWPVIFGGKPYWSVPAFIPITFEITILWASIAMVVTYYLINGQGPTANKPILHDRITDDKFCLAFNVTNENILDVATAAAFLQASGAELIEEKTI